MITETICDRDPIYDTDKFDVILVGTSLYNRMDGGFQSKIKFKYPHVDIENNKTKYGDLNKLGTRLTLNGKPIVSLLYMCKYPRPTIDTVDYEALRKCLLTANAEFKGLRVATTIIGSSQFDGNGNKDKCLELINECTPDLKLTVYDYIQKKRGDEIREIDNYISSIRLKNPDEYKYMKDNYESCLREKFLR